MVAIVHTGQHDGQVDGRDDQGRQGGDAEGDQSAKFAQDPGAKVFVGFGIEARIQDQEDAHQGEAAGEQEPLQRDVSWIETGGETGNQPPEGEADAGRDQDPSADPGPAEGECGEEHGGRADDKEEEPGRAFDTPAFIEGCAHAPDEPEGVERGDDADPEPTGELAEGVSFGGHLEFLSPEWVDLLGFLVIKLEGLTNSE